MNIKKKNQGSSKSNAEKSRSALRETSERWREGEGCGLMSC